MLVIREEPDVSTDTIAEVVIAEEEAFEEPEAPAPPAPKIVVEPTVVGMVEPPEVISETIAEVVIAEDDPPAPAPAVDVVVPVADVMVVKPVEVVTPAPVAVPVPVADAPPVYAAQNELP